MAAKFSTVEEYLGSLDPVVREQLEIVLEHARRAVPDAELVISYQMPTVASGGRRVAHLAGWKAHLAVYPVPDDEALQEELAPYRSGEGTLKFPLARPIPFAAPMTTAAFPASLESVSRSIDASPDRHLTSTIAPP